MALLVPRVASAEVSLYEAIFAGDAGAADSILRAGLMPDALLWNRGRPAGYPLPFAIQLGRYDVVRLLLDAGANPNHPPHPSPLRTAIERGDPDMVRLLLVRGADLENRDGAGETPLFLTARRGKGAVASVLLGFGADGRARGEDGSSLLEVAIRSGSLAVANLLVRKGVTLDERAVQAAVDRGLNEWPPVRVWLEEGREARVRMVCGEVMGSRSYTEVARFLRRDPDIPCRRALEARLGGFERELVVETRRIPWNGEERARPAAPGRVYAEVPLDGIGALEAAEKVTAGPLRARHVHGRVAVPLGDFLIIEASASVPETDVRADATTLQVTPAGEGFLSVESMDHQGFWTLNDLALVVVGTTIRVTGDEPVHLFGVDLLGALRITPDGIVIEPGSTLFVFPW
ncbi:MAG: ankyrin repeat domain-containing protein [Candidatus Eisenbacteria bacterium]